MRAADFDALIPIHAKPPHRVQELQIALFRIARGVSVFNADDEFAARVPRIGTVEQRRADLTDMRHTRRRGAKTDANFTSCCSITHAFKPTARRLRSEEH